MKIYWALNRQINEKKKPDKYQICPIDTTRITLTSKLFFNCGYHQVKLISGLNLATGIPTDNLVNFGMAHDYNYGQEMIDVLPSQ